MGAVAIRIAVAVALLGLGALALRHPAPRPAIVAQTALLEQTNAPRRTTAAHPEELVVYVAGAVSRPGLYRIRTGDRVANAVERAGGMARNADTSGVNLAQRAQDGDEIYVPALGESRRGNSATHRRSRRSTSPPPEDSIDVNRADARDLARVPGIGRSVASRIVELRAREGSFTSLDELLDVAGMTQSRLERARPYLRQP
jgi:competence protein ComEA